MLKPGSLRERPVVEVSKDQKNGECPMAWSTPDASKLGACQICILSKTGGLGDLGLTITERALAVKSEIDKIREQSLNLE